MFMKAAFGALALASLGLAAAPGVASARHHHRHYRHYACRDHRRTGTVVGAVGGGVIGNVVTHGSFVGTALGAGAGAVAGHEVGRHSC
ncbi:MAG TPA: glycine zipper 2TM domain-containing protein [Caulobacteraceae bacterium]|nr:glycine zipper 2TM domain-containing protein [Caulobacteraceae bacterium]